MTSQTHKKAALSASEAEVVRLYRQALSKPSPGHPRTHLNVPVDSLKELLRIIDRLTKEQP